MRCYKCNTDVTDTNKLIRNKKIKEFFLRENIIKDDADISILLEEYKLDTISPILYKKISNDSEFIMRFNKFRNEIYDINYKCPNCNEDISDNSFYYIIGSLYNSLSKSELDDFINYISSNNYLKIKELLNHLGETRDQLDFIYENRIAFLPDKYIEFENIYQFINSLEATGDRGGGEEWILVDVIKNIVTNEFVKNAIYDILKFGTISLFVYLVRKINYRKIQKKAIADSIKIAENSCLQKDDFASETIYSYLSKSERKKLNKKIAKRITRKMYKKIMVNKNF